MATIRPRKDRRPWQLLGDVWERTKRYDEILTESLDFTHELASGETVSSATVTGDGATISSVSVSSPNVNWTVTGSGYATVKATLSTGRKLERRVRWVATDETPVDYA